MVSDETWELRDGLKRVYDLRNNLRHTFVNLLLPDFEKPPGLVKTMIIVKEG